MFLWRNKKKYQKFLVEKVTYLELYCMCIFASPFYRLCAVYPKRNIGHHDPTSGWFLATPDTVVVKVYLSTTEGENC